MNCTDRCGDEVARRKLRVRWNKNAAPRVCWWEAVGLRSQRSVHRRNTAVPVVHVAVKWRWQPSGFRRKEVPWRQPGPAANGRRDGERGSRVDALQAAADVRGWRRWVRKRRLRRSVRRERQLRRLRRGNSRHLQTRRVVEGRRRRRRQRCKSLAATKAAARQRSHKGFGGCWGCTSRRVKGILLPQGVLWGRGCGNNSFCVFFCLLPSPFPMFYFHCASTAQQQNTYHSRGRPSGRCGGRRLQHACGQRCANARRGGLHARRHGDPVMVVRLRGTGRGEPRRSRCGGRGRRAARGLRGRDLARPHRAHPRPRQAALAGRVRLALRHVQQPLQAAHAPRRRRRLRRRRGRLLRRSGAKHVAPRRVRQKLPLHLLRRRRRRPTRLRPVARVRRLAGDPHRPLRRDDGPPRGGGGAATGGADGGCGCCVAADQRRDLRRGDLRRRVVREARGLRDFRPLQCLGEAPPFPVQVAERLLDARHVAGAAVARRRLLLWRRWLHLPRRARRRDGGVGGLSRAAEDTRRSPLQLMLPLALG